MVFKIGGSGGTDIVPLAAVNGISWKRTVVKGGNDTLMMDGTLLEDRLGSRYEWAFKFKPMKATEQAALLALLNASSVTVQYTDPQTNTLRTSVYYVSDVPSGYLVKRTNGTEYWGGISATFTAQPAR